MSLFGTLNTSISGMAAQASKLGTIGDNIANSATTGYKRASTEFETLLGNQATSAYQSGGVTTQVRYGITDQGGIAGTSSSTDLAIQGNGFFVVQDTGGGQALTRAGSFIPDVNGNLVNSAGYKLMGYNLASGGSSLQVVNVASAGLAASPSTSATLSVNVPSTATTVAAANLPSANATTATYTQKTSLVAYDSLGTPVNLDIYLTKSGVDSSGNPQWEAAVFNKANASATTGGFPYGTTAGASPMATAQTLTFSKSTGAILTGSTSTLSIPIVNGSTVSIAMGASTQLAAGFVVNANTIDGSSPSKLDKITVGSDGTVTQVYANGIQKSTFQVALATVQSPNLMTPETGNVYAPNSDSGSMVIDKPEANGLGKIDSASLESSTVDLATELTNMISAQRGYEANSKVLQTASDLLGVINNIHS